MSELPTYPNAVVYSEKLWAVARRSSSEDHDEWFLDSGAWRNGLLTSKELLDWADDWVEMRPTFKG